MEYPTIRAALIAADYTAEAVAAALNKAREDRKSDRGPVTKGMVLKWYGAYRKWPPWAVEVVYELLRRVLRLEKIELSEVQRLCGMNSEEIKAANAAKRRG